MSGARFLLAASLLSSVSACALKMETKGNTSTESSLPAYTTPEEKALLDLLEAARGKAIEAVQLLVDGGDEDRFLGKARFCGTSAFLCTKMGVSIAQQDFLQTHFLNPDAYAREISALRAATFIVTSNPTYVMVNGVVKTARANAADHSIHFYYPAVNPLTEPEKMATLLHEIWHHLGLPDENAYGPFALTQDAINASAAEQTVAWLARMQAAIPDNTEILAWPVRIAEDFTSGFLQRRNTSGECLLNGNSGPSYLYQMNVAGGTPCAAQLRDPRLSAFVLVTQGGGILPAQDARLVWTFKQDSAGNSYSVEYTRAANAGTGIARVFDNHDGQSELLQEYDHFDFDHVAFQVFAWQNTLTISGLGYPTIFLQNARNVAGTFSVELQNGILQQFALKTPF